MTDQETQNQEETSQPKQTPESPAQSFPIVGLGASAGGLEALEQFFRRTPPDSGMAFAVVQHLDPIHKSVLTELIGSYTSMDIFEVEEGMRVAPNCVYVIPPNREMTIRQGVLRLVREGLRIPIATAVRQALTQQKKTVYEDVRLEIKAAPRSLTGFEAFEIAYAFPETGSKSLRLDVRLIKSSGEQPALILLAIDDSEVSG